MKRFPVSKAAFRKYLETSKIKYGYGDILARARKGAPSRCPLEHAIVALVLKEKGDKDLIVAVGSAQATIGNSENFRLPKWAQQFIYRWDTRYERPDHTNNPLDYLK